jgi:hypothetical protein
VIVYQSKGGIKVPGTIFTCVGLILLAVAGWFGNRQYNILKTWPTVEATVAKSRVIHYPGRRGRITYEAEVEFLYTLGGKSFDTRSKSDYSTSSYSAMKSIADAFAPGTRHMVRYNPADPHDIRMNAGYNFGFFYNPLLLGAMGAFFTLIGIVMLAASRRAHPLFCPGCGSKVEPGQRFCPDCAAPLQSGEDSQTPPAKLVA